MIKLSIVSNLYNNRGAEDKSIEEFLKQFVGFSEGIKDVVEIIIVDDGSPIPIEVPEGYDTLNYKLLRIEQDIPWNQAGARNLGFLSAVGDKILSFDADNRVPEETVQEILAKDLGDKYHSCYYIKPKQGVVGACNKFAISRDVWLAYHGYDEDFSNNYGHEDTAFIALFPEEKRIKRAFLISLIDSPTPGLSKDTSINTALRGDKLSGKKPFSRDMLRFDWSLIEYNRRK